ncbi:uncharacterized protein [Montipora capricornis]|uniref:uncharacterized protein n=1 Tax=Montipora foliosa TaxID=591990 RepID=UPI0035F1670E
MRLIVFDLFLLLLMFVTTEGCYKQTNGCSVPGKLPFFYKKNFKPACDKHDVCYFCGEYYGWSRYRCDKAFLRDMRKICNRMSFFKRGACKVFAQGYYQATRLGGESHYSKNSPDWCEKPCVKPSGDPRRSLRV